MSHANPTVHVRYETVEQDTRRQSIMIAPELKDWSFRVQGMLGSKCVGFEILKT